MTLIVETGAGLPNSNAYADLTEADAFYADRNEADWASATDEERESALIRATDYIDANYVFKSVPLTDDQALTNPRFPDAELHPLLIKATILLAFHALTVNLNEHVTQREITRQREELANVAATDTHYDLVRPTGDPFPLITKTLRPIAPTRIGASASSMTLGR